LTAKAGVTEDDMWPRAKTGTGPGQTG